VLRGPKGVVPLDVFHLFDRFTCCSTSIACSKGMNDFRELMKYVTQLQKYGGLSMKGTERSEEFLPAAPVCEGRYFQRIRGGEMKTERFILR
jgi:hypothetical protein